MFTKIKPKHKNIPRMFKNWHSFKFTKLGQKVESTEAFSLLLSFMVNLIALYIFCTSLVYAPPSISEAPSFKSKPPQTNKKGNEKKIYLLKGGIFNSSSKIVKNAKL